MLCRRGQADRSGNCNAGLVVDLEIVHSTYMDFYLQSHSGILGSESTFLMNDCFQRLTHYSESPKPLCRLEKYVRMDCRSVGIVGASYRAVLTRICRLQELSYALCHVYGAATRSVSIPAPVYCTSACFRATSSY